MGFAHADDSAAADFQAGLFGILDRSESVVVGVGGNDFGKESPGRFQVMVVAVYAEGTESICLFKREASERSTAFRMRVGLGDSLEHRFEPVDVVVGGRSAAGDKAEGMGVEFFCGGGGREEFFVGSDMGSYPGLVVCGLSAETTIFRAVCGSGGSNGTESDFRATALDTDFVGPIEYFVSFFRGELDQVKSVVAVDGMAIEYGVGEL